MKQEIEARFLEVNKDAIVAKLQSPGAIDQVKSSAKEQPNRLAEAGGIVLTSTRYLLAERMARRVREDKPVFLDTAVFMAADVLDGVVLRQFNLDTPARRVADGVIDHLSIGRVMIELAKKHPSTKPYLGILAARAALVGGLNYLHYRKTGEVTKGQAYQKATNISSALFGLTSTGENKYLTHMSGITATSIATLTAPAHLKDIGTLHEEGIRKL